MHNFKWWLCAAALALVVMASGAQAQPGSLYQQPQGMLYERADGSHGYIVSSADRVGQWQVAFGSPQLWSELVSVNPQLADPDRIWPGDELNVPPSLVRLFQMMDAVRNAGGPMPAKGTGLPPVPAAATVTTMSTPLFPFFIPILILLFIIVAVMAIVAYLAHRSSKKNAQDASTFHEALEVLQRDVEADERSRRLSDPYSGPPIRENGLPTADAAQTFFAETYRTDRERMTVAASNALPPAVAIERIRAVDVRGPMFVDYATGPEQRDIPNWTPAWQCFFTDGTFRISLTACANDVRAGRGMQALPETQIRARQDVPETTPNLQVWPTVEPVAPVIAQPILPATVAEYTDAKMTSPTRMVLHRANGREVIIDISVLANAITLGVEGSNVYALIAGQRHVVGTLVGESADAPASAQADAIDAIVAAAEPRSGAVDRVVAATERNA